MIQTVTIMTTQAVIQMTQMVTHNDTITQTVTLMTTQAVTQMMTHSSDTNDDTDDDKDILGGQGVNRSVLHSPLMGELPDT